MLIVYSDSLRQVMNFCPAFPNLPKNCKTSFKLVC